MPVTIRDEVRGVGEWTATLNNTPVVKDLLFDSRNQPRLLLALIYDATVGGNLIYVGVLRRGKASPSGITIGGPDPRWFLGSGGVGLRIADREYPSGQDKLDNGSFDQDDLYWVRKAEGSFWVLAGGNAANVGGRDRDDVLEYDRKFPVRPGYAFQATATGVTGTGRLRIRTTYEGRFAPPNLLTNWLTADALTIGPITKPQLFNFTAGPTTLGTSMTFTGGTLTANSNPRPTYNPDAGFETGTGWTDVLTPAPMSNDIDLVNLPAEAASGSWVMEVGPITQHQVLKNSDFENGLADWFMSSEDATPDPGLFYSDATGGIDGSKSATTDGAAFATRILRYLRADSGAAAGVQAYDVKPGEQYLAEALVRAAPGTNGTAYISLHIPHPTVANRERWYVSSVLDGPKSADDVFRRMSIDLAIPANRFKVDALFEVHDCTTGYWAVDNFIITRTRGNQARIQSDTTTTVVPGTRYQGTVLMRSGGDMQVGSVRVGYILTGPTVDDRIVDVDKGSTDYEWTSVAVDFTPEDGYTTARRFVAGLDIVGEPAWIDNFQTMKMSNNTDTSTWASVAVVADRRYLFQANAEVVGAKEGAITVGIKLTGPAVAPEYIPLNLNVRDNAGVNALSTEVRPPPGYNAATLYVQSTDVVGGSFKVYSATLTKMDNNTAETLGSTIAVTPERSYRWSQEARSGLNLQRGTVKLSVTCKRTGYPNKVFESSAIDATKGDRKELTLDFTPPSGYDTFDPRVIGTDVEGDNWTVGLGQIRDTDTGSVVFDAVTAANPSGVSLSVNSTTPAGATTARVALIVEQGTTGWTVGSVSFKRTGVTPATGAAIIADLLKDPDTSQPLSLVAGTITAPAVIPADWQITNLDNREALDYLCDVIYDGGLEQRVIPANPPRLNVGPATSVFTDHSPSSASPIVLLPRDRDVLDLSDPESDVTERPTQVLVEGAERTRLDGRTYLVTALAAVPGPTEYDSNNRPVVRTKEVSDATVDHDIYAQALAADLAAKEAKPALSLSVKLSGKQTRASCPPGDTIYAYNPKANLIDTANVATIEGETVFPRAVTVLSRQRILGPSHRLVVLDNLGVQTELAVLWSEEDATTLTIGDRLFSWQADPQAQAVGYAYLRDRASRPR